MPESIYMSSNTVDQIHRKRSSAPSLSDPATTKKLRTSPRTRSSKMTDVLPDAQDSSSRPVTANTSPKPSAYVKHHSDHISMPNQYYRVAKGAIIEVVVGKKKTSYMLHKDLLIARSPYFATSLKHCWNGKRNKVDLLNEDCTAFEAFVDWLYKEGPTAHIFEGEILNISYLAACYKLADKFMIESLKNQLVNDLRTKCMQSNSRFGFDAVLVLHKCELCQTKLYQLAMRSSVCFFVECPEAFEADRGGLDEIHEVPELAKDIMEHIRQYNKDPWEDFWEEPRCTYHDHTDGRKCN
ncbi:hypothetical protein OHC33_010005 [Knufia fluminis]|uniref:BTB domain-containing protein n=1 Tax=Knufia fluminis TaxID=191047 RepID=A0AAN8I2L7_9EURO|nr:hypothetical protein OHC33_010005 [Knufia fluminis]